MERLTKHHTTGSGPGAATSSPSCPRGTGVCRAGRLEIRQHLSCDSPRTLEILPTYLQVFLCLTPRNSTLHCDQLNGRRSDTAFNPPRDKRALCAARRCTFCMGGSSLEGGPTIPQLRDGKRSLEDTQSGTPGLLMRKWTQFHTLWLGSVRAKLRIEHRKHQQE